MTINNVTLESIVIVCNWVDRLNSDKITNQKQLLAEKRTSMKYNQVRIGDGVIVNEKNIVIHSLGILD